MATQPGLTDTSHDERRRSVANIRTEKTPMNEALTFNKDGAKRYADIHWPDGFHPEQADFFAHNEIVVNASCKTVWDHVIEAEKWPSWYSNSHNMKLLNSADGKLHEDTRFSGIRSASTSTAASVNSLRTAASGTAMGQMPSHLPAARRGRRLSHHYRGDREGEGRGRISTEATERRARRS
jgi:hypothetical protein